jgi:SAM-dependent methyltransferase
MIYCPLPPQQFMDAVAGEPTTDQMHIAVGKHVHDLVVQHCRVGENARILDIGSGCGRVASQFMGEVSGEYHGIDVVLPMVEWCRTNISSRDAHFCFHHADLSNTLYRGGRDDAAGYEFPFPKDTFEAIFATSVFTHLVPASANQYAREICRVLKPGGRALLTFYLLNDKWRQKILAGSTVLQFPVKGEGYRTFKIENPEGVIAYEQRDALQMFEAAGLRIECVSLGAWSGNADGWTGQDAILVTK